VKARGYDTHALFRPFAADSQEGPWLQAEQVTDPVAHHGEGPVWSARWGGLRWVDMLAGDVLQLCDGGEPVRRHISDVVAAMRPRTNGGAVYGIERGFALEEPDGTVTRLPDLWRDPLVRMNEGGCDPDGRFYCGSMAYDKTPGAGALHRLDPDGSIHRVLSGVTVSNGLGWTPDGSSAYYVDTDTHRIVLFDYDRKGGFSGERTFAEVDPADGRPDGIAVDSLGGVWVALNGGGVVRRYASSGAVDEVVEVGAAKVTACTFGGASFDELYITTSREDLPPGRDPLAGALFRAPVGVAGQPVREYGG
jgi:sugar lactone lactonase YvrE